MPPYYPMTGPPNLSPAEQLGRLRSTLEALAADLRRGIARSVAQAVSGAVEQALAALLGKTPGRPQWPCRQEHTSWPPRQPTHWDDDPEDDEDLEPWGRGMDPPRVAQPPAEKPAVGRWISALAAGVKASCWWLQGRFTKRSTLTTLAVGLVAGIAVLATGSGILGLAGTALGALALSDAARSGTAVLAGAVTR